MNWNSNQRGTECIHPETPNLTLEMESFFCAFSKLRQLYIYPGHTRDGTWNELLAFCSSKISQGLEVELTTRLRDLSFRCLYQSMHESRSIAARRVGDRGMCQEREFPQWPSAKSLQKRNEPPLPIRWRALATANSMWISFIIYLAQFCGFVE
jgi:hypothetical protein